MKSMNNISQLVSRPNSALISKENGTLPVRNLIWFFFFFFSPLCDDDDVHMKKKSQAVSRRVMESHCRLHNGKKSRRRRLPCFHHLLAA
jgi:hypothetical protein